MKKCFLIVLILFIACQKEEVQKSAINRAEINSELFEILNDSDSLRVADFAKRLENLALPISEKKALQDCIILYHHKNKFNYTASDSLSWTHIDLLYNKGYKEVSLFYARYKFNAEFLNKTLPDFLTKIDSALLMFSDYKSNCQYANLLQLKITHLMAKSYYNLALKEMQSLLKSSEIVDSCPQIRYAVYMEMSFMYADLKLLDKSLESAYKALSYAENATDKAVCNSLIAKAYLELNQPENGVTYITTALGFVSKDHVHMLNYCNAILLEAYVALEQYSKADALFKTYESSEGFLKYHHYLFCRAKANSLKKRKMYAESIHYYLKAKSFVPEEKLLTRRIILKDLSDIYSLHGNLTQALFYLNAYQEKEELYTKQHNEDLINEQTVALKVAENEAELLKTKKKAVEQELSIARKNKTIVVGVLITIALILLTVVILYFNRLYKKKNIELATEKQKVEQTNNELQAALFEKSLLMREIHHRVKNHLQFLMSILRIQGRLSELSIEEFVERSNVRLTAIASIHEQLYESSSDEHIAIVTYIEKIALALQNIKDVDFDFSINSDPEDLYVSNHVAVSMGLILNELISNSFKHAFHGENNFIKIHIRVKEDRLYFTYEDSGLQAEHAEKVQRSSGVDIIKILAQQLQANIAFSNHYSCVSFDFEFH